MLRLRSLELNGYKTFATKTQFEFSGQITAVVGPNGSGKSNIADALRWVLGEQSYSLLRARKTDDMIFSGSETRARAGMASATVTFDNSDGWLPIDFSEVSITRRAYRDGQNDYLINNQRVRLRDVNELLFKSGLSERTYTVIGQGLVDTALSLKPEERRRLFEEAAGIGLYRKRKNQALRRLETTRRNLERVQDILAELEPRLKSLERQARRAREHVQIRKDLEEILREWYGYHWHHRQRELLEARQFAREQENSLENDRKSQSDLELSLNESRSNVNGLRSRLNSWHRQLAQIHMNREETSRDLAISTERRRSLIERRDRLQSEIAALEHEANAMQVRLDEATSYFEQLQNEAEEAETRSQETREALIGRKQTRQQAEQALAQIKQRIAEINTEKARLGARQEEIEKRTVTRASNIDETRAALDEVQQALVAAEGKREQAEKERLEAASKRVEAENDLDEQRERLEKLNEEHRKLEHEESNLLASLARMQAQLDVLQQAEKELTGYAEGAKHLLEAARKGQLSRARGALSRQLNVETKYERAIIAALGDFLDAVLLQDDQAIGQALNLLTNNPGRAALLPLGQLAPQNSLKAPKVNGCFGVASQLVDAEPELRPGIDLLLGQVLVVDNHQTARRVLAGKEPFIRAVTLKGEVFHSSGAIQINNQSDTSTLSRQRQLRELSKAIDNANLEIDRIKQKIESSNGLRAETQTTIKECQDKLKKAQSELESRQATLQSNLLEVEQVRSSLTWHRNQLAAIDKEAAQAKQQSVEAAEQIDLLDQEKAEAEENLRQLNIKVAELPLDEHQRQVNYWEKQAAISQQAVNNAKETLVERQQAVEKIRQQIAAFEEQHSEVSEQIDRLKSHVTEMRDSEGGIGEKIVKIQGLIDPAETELKQAEEKLLELETEESQARQGLQLAERRHSQAQINLVRKQETLDGLKQRIEDDFGLVAFDYDQQVSGPTPLPFDDMVERLPMVTEISEDLEQELKRKRVQLRRMGSINPEADQEYTEVQERYEFLTVQMADLNQAEEDIREVIAELDELMSREFRTTFDEVAHQFKEIFQRLFRGGSARLLLTDENNPNETGVDIEARLPGKRMQRLALLSGGERAMTAVALVFALIKASPTPFCVLDEVDATLDESNIKRLSEILMELAAQTQFVIITHNRNTVQVANLIYGITLGRDTTSQTISLRLEDVDERFTE